MTMKAGFPGGKEYRAVSGASAPLQLGPKTTHPSSLELSSSMSYSVLQFLLSTVSDSFLIIYISWSHDAISWLGALFRLWVVRWDLALEELLPSDKLLYEKHYVVKLQTLLLIYLKIPPPHLHCNP